MTALCDGGNNLSHSSYFFLQNLGLKRHKGMKKKKKNNPGRRLKYTIQGNTWNVRKKLLYENNAI
jgi:hypothetical protein